MVAMFSFYCVNIFSYHRLQLELNQIEGMEIFDDTRESLALDYAHVSKWDWAIARAKAFITPIQGPPKVAAKARIGTFLSPEMKAIAEQKRETAFQAKIMDTNIENLQYLIEHPEKINKNHLMQISSVLLLDNNKDFFELVFRHRERIFVLKNEKIKRLIDSFLKLTNFIWLYADKSDSNHLKAYLNQNEREDLYNRTEVYEKMLPLLFLIFNSSLNNKLPFLNAEHLIYIASFMNAVSIDANNALFNLQKMHANEEEKEYLEYYFNFTDFCFEVMSKIKRHVKEGMVSSFVINKEHKLSFVISKFGGKFRYFYFPLLADERAENISIKTHNQDLDGIISIDIKNNELSLAYDSLFDKQDILLEEKKREEIDAEKARKMDLGCSNASTTTDSPPRIFNRYLENNNSATRIRKKNRLIKKDYKPLAHCETIEKKKKNIANNIKKFIGFSEDENQLIKHGKYMFYRDKIVEYVVGKNKLIRYNKGKGSHENFHFEGGILLVSSLAHGQQRQKIYSRFILEMIEQIASQLAKCN